jgi:hypothetical protein
MDRSHNRQVRGAADTVRRWLAKGSYAHSLGVWIVLVGCVSLAPYLYLWLTWRSDHTPTEIQQAIFGRGGWFLTSIGLLAGSAKLLIERHAIITVGIILLAVSFCAVQYGSIIGEVSLSRERLAAVIRDSVLLVIASVGIGMVATVWDVASKRKAEVSSDDE